MNELFNQGLEKDDSKNRTVIHTLRHTFASHLAINGTPIFTGCGTCFYVTICLFYFFLTYSDSFRII